MNDYIKNYLNEIVPEHEFNGSVFVTHKKQPIIRAYYGVDMAGVALSEKTRFHSTALTQTFTTAAIMLLIEEGKLSFDDKLIKFFPSLKNFGEITITHMLRGQTGLPDYVFDINVKALFNEQRSTGMDFTEYSKRKALLSMKNPQIEEILSMLEKAEPLYAPGKNNEWSASNMLLLGEIITLISGKSLAEFFKQRFFDPLSMSSATLGGCDVESAIRVDNGELVYVGKNHNANGASGVVATMEDFERWISVLLNGGILSKESRKWLLSKYYKNRRCIFDLKDNGLVLFDGLTGQNFFVNLNLQTKTSVLILTATQIKTVTFQSTTRHFPERIMRAVSSQYNAKGNLHLAPVNNNKMDALFSIEILPSQTSFVMTPIETFAMCYITKRKAFALMDGKNIVGIASFNIDKKEDVYTISIFQIDRHYQNKGYGKKFIVLCRDYLIKQGAKKILIYFIQKNYVAEKTYASCGFVNFEFCNNAIGMVYKVNDKQL